MSCGTWETHDKSVIITQFWEYTISYECSLWKYVRGVLIVKQEMILWDLMLFTVVMMMRTCGHSPEDGNITYIRKIGIYVRVY